MIAAGGCSASWIACASSSATACAAFRRPRAALQPILPARPAAQATRADRIRRARHGGEINAPAQIVGHQAGLLRHVAQLADVARPGLARQQFSASTARLLCGMPLRRAMSSASASASDSRSARRSRSGSADQRHVEPVVQVGAELPAPPWRQVAAGGGDHAHVDMLHLVAAQRFDPAPAARSSLACSASGMSPISSRNRRAAMRPANLPSRPLRSAPV